RITFLIVEQSVPRALDVANTAYLLRYGKVVMSGASEELKKSELIKEAYFDSKAVHRGDMLGVFGRC
ncbi:MAG: hypothetical protein ACP5RJ_08615, partial [Conexivisphaera sp.]